MPTRDFFRLWLPAFATAAVLFTLFPAIDLAVARPFWAGGYDDWPIEAQLPVVADLRQWIRYVVWMPVVAVGLGALVALAGAWLPPAVSPRFLNPRFVSPRFVNPRFFTPTVFSLRAFLYLVLTYAIGPGLVTNALLKAYWGRARPLEVAAFGGAAPFSPALLPSGAGGVSFVSGEVAMAAAACALCLLVTGRARVVLFALGFALAALVGLIRIAQGGHFLSDVVFAMLLVWLVAWLSHSLVFRWTPTRVSVASPSDRLESR